MQAQAPDCIYLPTILYQKMARNHRTDDPEWQWIQPFDETVKESSIWTGTGNFQYQYWYEDFSDEHIVHRTDPRQEIMIRSINWSSSRLFIDKLPGNDQFDIDLVDLHEDDVFQGWTMNGIVHGNWEIDYHNARDLVQGLVTTSSFYYRDQMLTIPSLRLDIVDSYYYYKETNAGAVYHWFNGRFKDYIKVTFKN